MANDIGVPADNLAEAWRRLDPVKPLPSGSPWYVDCADERGTHNFVERILQAITWATEGQGESAFVHDLVVGHRGSGKSTELLRLKDQLEHEGFYVHYVDLVTHKDANDLDSEAILTILLRCLVEDLGSEGIQLRQGLLDSIAEWFSERVKTTVGSKSAQVGAEVDAALGSKSPLVSLLARFTGFVRWGTETRDTLTVEYVNYLTELRGMVDALLIDAGLKLRERPQYRNGLVIIADSLDHITLPARQDEIFIDSAEILTKLSAHLLVTVPSALLATGRDGDLLPEVPLAAHGQGAHSRGRPASWWTGEDARDDRAALRPRPIRGRCARASRSLLGWPCAPPDPPGPRRHRRRRHTPGHFGQRQPRRGHAVEHAGNGPHTG